jgi:hypothetical protein
VARNCFDLARQTLDALVQPAPVARQVLDAAHHTGRQHVAARGEDHRQLAAQEAQALPHGNPSLQQKGTDLIDGTVRATQRCILGTLVLDWFGFFAATMTARSKWHVNRLP